MVCGGLALWEKNKDVSYTPRVRETFDLDHQGGGGVFRGKGKTRLRNRVYQSTEEEGKVCSVNVETSGGFGEEAGRLGQGG